VERVLGGGGAGGEQTETRRGRAGVATHRRWHRNSRGGSYPRATVESCHFFGGTMRRFAAVLALLLAPLAASAPVRPGHHLPEGADHPVRDREYHIEKYVAELFFDMAKEEIAGTATITFASLRAPLTTLSLDAARLDVSRVERDGRTLEFKIDPK